eukprot:scaffold11649_cov126-Isochrysis_galbana.AAC.5
MRAVPRAFMLAWGLWGALLMCAGRSGKVGAHVWFCPAPEGKKWCQRHCSRRCRRMASVFTDGRGVHAVNVVK